MQANRLRGDAAWPSAPRLLAAGAAATALGGRAAARAQAPTLRIGVLTDMSGPYRDIDGPGSVALTQQAVEDFGSHGFQVEVLQRRPPEQARCRRQHRPAMVRPGRRRRSSTCPPPPWRSPSTRSRGRRTRSILNSGAATSDLTGAHAAQHRALDLRHLMLANGTGAAVVKTGGDTWFFLTADYAFGHALERDTTAFVEAARRQGGRRRAIPSRRPPTSPSFLLQAQASRAKVLGLANAGGDTVNCIKQAREFGLQAARNSPRCSCSSSTCMRSA